MSSMSEAMALDHSERQLIPVSLLFSLLVRCEVDAHE